MSRRGLKPATLKKRPPKASQTQDRKSLLKLMIGAVLGISTLLGVPAAIMAFYPRINVNASDPVDPDNPFSASVTVTNTGFSPLDNVTPEIAMGKISVVRSGHPLDLEGAPDFQTRFYRLGWGGQDLGLDDKFTFALNDAWTFPRDQLTAADIAIVIIYRVPIVHWKREKIFPMSARRQSNGNFYWYASARPN